MKEYGSNIQKLVSNIVNIDDREKRTRHAHILVELMRQIHPNMRDGQDYYNKLWDDLYIISGWKLDVDSPYPPPSPEVLGKKPQRVPYNTHNLRFKHFGYNMGLLIDKAVSIDDADEKRAFVSYLVRLMRTFYATWAKENVEDEAIFQSLIELSKGRLRDDVEIIRTEGLVEGTPRERTGDQPQRISNQPQQRQGGQTTRSYPNNGGQSYGNSRNDGPRNDGDAANRPRNEGQPRNNPGQRSNNANRDGGQNTRNNNQRGPGGQPRNGGNGSSFRPNNNRDGGTSNNNRDGGDSAGSPERNRPRNDGQPPRRRR